MQKREAQPASTNAGGLRHCRAKPVEVSEGLFRIVLEAPDASCRKIAERFDRDHIEQGLSIGKTYAADFLREFKEWRAAPKRHEHSTDNACAVNRVWAIDFTQHGFRSTFRDWAGETTAFPREVIDHALAHQLRDKAEAAYQRGDLLRKRAELMEAWSEYCK